jgi:hypothetical protein
MVVVTLAANPAASLPPNGPRDRALLEAVLGAQGDTLVAEAAASRGR